MQGLTTLHVFTLNQKKDKSMKIKSILATLLALLFITSTTIAQDVTYTLQEINEFVIDGDSNVRDWDADVSVSEGTLVLENIEEFTLENLTPEVFKSLKMTMPVRQIDSDSRRLNNNLHDYLLKDDHPNITFELVEITGIEVDGNSAVITANGVINAAGVDFTTTMNVNATLNGDSSITFSGAQDLLMTSFNIDPPTAAFGTIRAADEMVIRYNVTFRK